MQGESLIFYCKHCRAPIGVQTGAALIIGAVRFLLAVTMECLLCKRTVRWYPAPKMAIEQIAASKDVAPASPPGVESNVG